MTRFTRYLLLAATAGLCVLSAHAALDLPHDDAASGPTIEVPAPTNRANPAEPQVDPFSDLLLFRNGDRLHGRLVSVKANESLLWEHREIAAATTIGTSNLHAIDLGAKPRQEWMRQQTRVQLTNEDVLFGRIVSLRDEELVLEAPYGGEIRVKRSMINSIMPAGVWQGTLIYEGPNDISEWERTSGEWQVRADQLIGHGRVGANVKLPEMSRLRFDVRWPERFRSFVVALYTPDLKNFQNDAYHLTFSGNNVSLHRRATNSSILNLGQVQLDELMGQRKGRIEILVNKADRSFALLFDDKLIKEWSDPQGFAGKGTGLVFNSHDRNAPMSISNIRVSEWDGKLSSVGKLDADSQDVLQMANYDRVSGTIEAIVDDHVTFKTPYATMQVPLARVATLVFAGEHAERARRNAGDVELYFDEGEHLTLRLQGIDGTRVTGYSENFGVVNLDLSAFMGMRFNIYDDPMEDMSMLPAGDGHELEQMQRILHFR